VGRLIEVRRPGLGNDPAFIYAYATPTFSGGNLDRPAYLQTRRRDDANTSVATYLESWQYYDGLGQLLQSQTEVTNGERSVSDTAYNSLRRTYTQSQPYTQP